MKFNWFPGHMEKARQELENKLKGVDFIIELVDSRIPFSSRNPMIENIIKNKPKILLMTKLDLCDLSKIQAWKKYYEDKGYIVLELNTLTFKNFKVITKIAEEICIGKREKEIRKGIRPQPLKTMVVGVPNVGKSTFINYFSKKKVASVANKPGHTRQQQWIKLDKEIHLLDTPGILWPKISNERVALNLSVTNSIKLEILPKEEIVQKIMKFLQKNYLGQMKSYMNGFEEDTTYEELITLMGKQFSLKQKEETLEYDSVNKFLHDLVNGEMGKFTFEIPKDFS